MSGIIRWAVRRPWLTVLAWVSALVLVSAVGRILDAPPPSSSFLPASAESQRAAALAAARFGGGNQTATIVIADHDGLNAGDQSLAAQIADWLNRRPPSAQILSVSPAQPSPDGRAVVLLVTFATSTSVDEQPDATIAAIEEHLARLRTPPGVEVGITGDPVVNHDIGAGIGGSDPSGRSDLLRAVSVALVVMVLAVVYRAPLAVLVPLGTIAVVLAISSSLLEIAAATVSLALSSFSLPFVFAVTLGAGTNYGIFLISRHREQLQRGAGHQDALTAAARGVAPAIASSAATVVLGTAAMAFTALGFFRTLGPAVAVSVLVMLAAGLTLTPALIAITGRAFFWPRAPSSERSGRISAVTAWHRVGVIATRWPGVVLALAVLGLGLPALGSARVQVSVDTLGSLPYSSPSLQGYHLLRAHVQVRDQAASVLVVADGTRLESTGAELSHVHDVLSTTPGVRFVGDPALSSDGGAARFPLALEAQPSSEEASATLTAAEAAAKLALGGASLHDVRVLAGGEVAVDRDLRELLAEDFLRVLLLVGGAIYLVLAILLRNLLAPVYLLASVGLSTSAAIGGVGLLYRVAAGQPLYWAVPVFAFVFLVALGEDFNIYLVSRLRQEIAGGDRAAGIARAVGLTGGVISSAGLVMAAAFGLFLGNPVLLVQQLGAVVVAGLLLDTFLVRPLVVPALVQLLGRWSGISAARRDDGLSATAGGRACDRSSPGRGPGRGRSR